MNKRKSGFTLVEVVISLALGGLILSSVMSLFVGFFQTWNAEKTPYEKFIDHINNTVRFLQNQLNSTVPIVDKNQIQPSRYHCVKIVNKGLRMPSNWCLGILTARTLPFFHKNNEGVMWQTLIVSDKGLSMMLEYPEIINKRMAEGVENTGKTKMEHFLLSPYVKDMLYGHYDFDKGNWEFTASLEDYCKRFSGKDFSQRPEGLQLVFKKEDWEEKRFIVLNNAIKDVSEKPLKQKTKNDDKQQK